MPLSLQTCSSTGEALAALAGGAGRHYLGGGTLLVRRANEGDIGISTFVRATDPSLSAIEVGKGEVRLGAGVTMAEVARHPALGFLAPAARAVGGPAIRNMATLGGNLHAPAPYGDFAVALLALDAVLTVEASEGRRSVPVEAYLQAPGGIVTAAQFRLPVDGHFRFLKASRVKPKGLSVVTIAAIIAEKGGLVASARIALGCMAPLPMRARTAEAALVGRPLTAEGIAPALVAVLEGTDPITDAIASAWYRREVLPVHFGRLLLGPVKEG